MKAWSGLLVLASALKLAVPASGGADDDDVDVADDAAMGW